MSTLNSGLWGRLHRGLEKIAEEKHSENIPVVKLVIAAIISAGEERDLCYIGSNEFLYHCHLAGMNSDYVGKMIQKAWYYIDNNISILPEEEDIIDNED